MNQAPNETWIHSWRFASTTCQPLHHPSHCCFGNPEYVAYFYTVLIDIWEQNFSTEN